MAEKVDCRKCKYFYITWDQNFPMGCKLFKFKTQRLPSYTVYESLGHECTNFESKKQIEVNKP